MAKKSAKKSKKVLKKKSRPPHRPPARPAARKTRVSAPAAKAPAKPVHKKTVEEKPLSDADIQRFRDVLSHKRDELLAVVQRKKEQELQVEEADIGDEADVATRSVEKEMLFELTDSEKQTLDMIEAALRKIEKGVYGRCESCRKFILRPRLEVMPWARYCMPCQSEQEIPSAD